MSAATPPATAGEIAGIRRRYLWMATSVFFLDLSITLIFTSVSGSWANFWRSGGIGVVFLLAGNWLVARWLFEPIRRYLEGGLAFEQIERRLTQLPLLTAQCVAGLSLVAITIRTSTPWWVDPGPLALLKPTIADFIAVVVVLSVVYFTYTYFVVSDYLAKLCAFIFRHQGRNLGLFFGSYTAKLVVALLVISIGPLAAIVVDLFSYDGERLQSEILVDVSAAAIGVAMSAYFIGRSLLRPLRVLSRAMSKVADGDFTLRVPVTSNDEVGEVTGQFNTMVEGLRERERIRETFGRYVDESVAATILQDQGGSVPASETREATILFTDIESFTSIAELLEPDRLIAALNEYLETVLEPIRAHGGVVNTFIGDGLFASFNMPLLCHDHACAAVRAAIDIQRAVASRTFGPDGVAFATRIGINTGKVIGGTVGAGQRMSFTLMGDAVNLAARLEQLNKDHGTRILVSESTREACGDRLVFRGLGSVPVRGRMESATVFAVDVNEQA